MSQEASRERIAQKARTRTALLVSAGALVRAGKRPTVEDAAVAAGISKRTAYRYFVSQEHLLADAALETLRPRVDEIMAAVDQSDDVYARVAALAVALRRLAEEHDRELREMIRASLDRHSRPEGAAAPPQRGGRRLEWIRASLEPLAGKLSDDRLAQLTDCLAVCVGIDALLVLRDICDLPADKIEARMTWMAGALLDRAIREGEGAEGASRVKPD